MASAHQQQRRQLWQLRAVQVVVLEATAHHGRLGHQAGKAAVLP